MFQSRRWRTALATSTFCTWFSGHPPLPGFPPTFLVAHSQSPLSVLPLTCICPKPCSTYYHLSPILLQLSSELVSLQRLLQDNSHDSSQTDPVKYVK